MIVVDTSAWIEWLIGSQLGAIIAPQLPQQAEWLVPTIVQLELQKWMTREVGENKADLVMAYMNTCLIVALDTPLALLAADLCAKYKLATADAIVYASALFHGATLLTCDRHFENLPGVTYIPRTNSRSLSDKGE